MEWTDEVISRLQTLWQEGLSTAEIGRQLNITKNAVVGKAHRLGLPPRPSPIRTPAKPRKNAKADAPKVEAVAETVEASPVADAVSTVKESVALPQTPSVSASVSEKETKVAPKKVADAAPVVETAAPKTATVKPEKPKVDTGKTMPQTAAEPAEPRKLAPEVTLRPLLRPLTPEPSPRRGPSCCWPIGDPGTPGFHFCGAHPVPGKPYCAEHCAVAYVKLRDRRENAG